MVGYIVFGAVPIGISVSVGVCSFISVHYLLNQSMDFDQTCIYKLVGREKELNFCDLN